jgi:hypothetical protein
MPYNVESYIAGDLASPIFNTCQSRLIGAKRKDTHRKPSLPSWLVADIMGCISVI